MPSTEKEGFSFLIAMAFTLNYIIGSGFLTIPWAFAQTGFVLGVTMLVILSLFATVAVVFIIESMARAERIQDSVGEHRLAASIQSEGKTYNSIGVDDRQGINADHNDNNQDVYQGIYSGRHKFEMTDLCMIFLGKKGLAIYTILIILYFYGTLWAYSTVFANAFNTITGWSYGTFLFLFAPLVTYFSICDLTEQVTMQVTMSIWRIIMITTMIGTILISYLFHTEAFGHISEAPNTESFFDKVDFSGLHILLPIVTYANIFHHSIPALSQPVADKKELSKIFTASLAVCAASYLLIGVTVASYFGDSMKQSSNLNWATYIGSESAGPKAKFISKILSVFVVLFPAVDVFSAYSLNAITLGNNLMTTLFPGIEDSAPEEVFNTKVFFRVLAAVPPLIGAYYVRDLGKITKYTGICGFGITFVFPALLARYSEQLLKDSGLPHSTWYSNRLCGGLMQQITFIFGIFVVVYVFSCNIIFPNE